MNQFPRIAVLGADGQVGSALLRRAGLRHISAVGFVEADADLTDVDALRRVMTASGADVCINTAAYTAVDRAESEPTTAFAVNQDGARNVREACRAAGARLFHLSTDYVFDGTQSAPYSEADVPSPVGVYARSKAGGETAVLSGDDPAIVLRTAWVFGLEGNNFVKTMLRLGAEREVVRVVNDQRSSPTYAEDLADAIIDLAQRTDPSPAGIYHVAGQGVATWYEFAREIFAEAAARGLKTPRLEAITTAEYPTPAKRPANSVLDCNRVKLQFGIAVPHWRDGLRRMVEAHLGAAVS